MSENLDSKQNSEQVDYGGTAELHSCDAYLKNYNRDLIRKLTKHSGNAKSVLEFGAGLGTLALLWERVTGIKPDCVELDPKQCAAIRSRGLRCEQTLGALNATYDLVYTSNVLEHIEDDVAALIEIGNQLKDSGALVVYVPAFQSIFSEFDQKIGHFRRYSRRELVSKVKAAGFKVDKVVYADSVGFFAWYYMKLRGYSENASHVGKMKVFDAFVFPVSQLADFLGFKFLFGKNLLLYATKTR